MDGFASPRSILNSVDLETLASLASADSDRPRWVRMRWMFLVRARMASCMVEAIVLASRTIVKQNERSFVRRFSSGSRQRASFQGELTGLYAVGAVRLAAGAVGPEGEVHNIGTRHSGSDSIDLTF